MVEWTPASNQTCGLESKNPTFAVSRLVGGRNPRAKMKVIVDFKYVSEQHNIYNVIYIIYYVTILYYLTLLYIL